MGLDSYLYAEKFLTPQEDEGQFKRIVSELGLTDLVPNVAPTAKFRVEVAYWRKANQIHKFFVDLSGEEDNCQDIDVSRDDLEDLLNLCKKALKAREEPLEDLKEGEIVVGPEGILPTQSGFFFGSTDYDDYYYQNLEDTVEMLEKILRHEDFKGNWNWSFVYRASW